ncbi:hypothetical protein [Acrocarpospora sp. B8E8]|uniref:hypothetical protein n=1 Tax=Acrocarpospora sp. B8E8 TaxID=3153572 RepID=UPI00325EFD8D
MNASMKSTEGDLADELIGYDPRLRCHCVTRLHPRCIRKATAEDGMCDDCRAMRAKNGHRDHMIQYVTVPALRDSPDRTWAVLEERRGHAVLMPGDEEFANSRFMLGDGLPGEAEGER